MSLTTLVRDVRRCTVCAPDLPLGPRPIVSLPRQTRILIIGQAPGTAVHESGVAWDDPSGDHLRSWMGISRDVFYKSKRIGISALVSVIGSYNRLGNLLAAGLIK